MPKKTNRQKRARKTRTMKKYHSGKLRQFMRDPVYFFKRKIQHTFNPSQSDSIAPWIAANGGLVYTHNFRLSDLPNYTDFTNLFESYKVMGIQLEINCASTEILGGNRAAQGSTAVVLRAKPNNDCRYLTSGDTVDKWLQRTDVKRYNFPNNYKKPLQIYEPCKMSNNLTDNYPEVVKPGWIPTANYNNKNFSFDLRMDGLSGEDITSSVLVGVPSFTIIETVYLAFKGVE